MEPIRFTLNRVSAGRMGSVVFQGSAPFFTPGCMLYAQSGSVPHLTLDNLQRVVDVPWPIVIPLQSVYDMLKSVKTFRKPLGEFCGLPARNPVIIPLHEALREVPTGNNDSAGVAIWKPAGRVRLSSENLVELISVFKPSAYQALTDGDTPQNCSNKRLNHSVTRSVDYLEECLKLHGEQSLKSGVLASIQGGFDVKSRKFSIRGTLENESRVSGYIIDGFHYNGESTALLNYSDIEDVLTATLKELPEDKPRFMLGCFNPDLVMKLVEAGVDCFDSSFACLCSDRGQALNFTFQDVKLAVEGPRYLQLNETHYKDDMRLISENCKCYTCTEGFTRAYVNHLLVTREMLAQVLLQLHNLHHYLKFFESLRSNFSKS
ncbi:queuine tRNA-ribosyltransferase accessory subunit 2 [Galendromus occidentalis]|uniref:Queuine tRNA-ribosyltransferase accessory subunit 2 n=1 Tax=Galendromus occidentalis TaxID=34638 RepID=A0AAJ6QYT8_9ACAR|nr:queuine tRNA-ribosyltransferase accessory subunit 2 [Galendromus occidentalis]